MRAGVRSVNMTTIRIVISNILKAFLVRERSYDDAGLTPEEKLRERQSLETKGLLIELRSLFDSELSQDPEFRSQ